MIEITSRKIVKVRKAHECHGCTGVIAKAEEAVCVKGKEDGRHVSLHLHAECHLKAMKLKLYDIGFEKGALMSRVFEDEVFGDVELPFV